MGANDMNHMRHLESVALSDCAVLESKEATYQGSWKRAGGRSAWFMARRNLDRLITMMKPPQAPDIYNDANIEDTIRAIANGTKMPGTPEATATMLRFMLENQRSEDMFAKIAEKPKGEDGTVLACLRDARRYFMLVEAEMISEGIVEPESKTYESDAYPMDVYGLISNDLNLHRDVVKDLINDLFYSDLAGHAQDVLRGYAVIAKAETDIPTVAPAHPVGVDQSGRIVFPEPGPSGGIIPDTPSCGDGSFDVRMQRLEEAGSGGRYASERARAVADGGSQHATQNHLWPWHATTAEVNAIRSRIGDDVLNFYTLRAVDLHQLEMVVENFSCPKELYPAYDLTADKKWLLKYAPIPEEIKGNFTQLQLEKNQKEYEEGDTTTKFMYSYHEGPQKWILKNEYSAWGRDVG